MKFQVVNNSDLVTQTVQSCKQVKCHTLKLLTLALLCLGATPAWAGEIQVSVNGQTSTQPQLATGEAALVNGSHSSGGVTISWNITQDDQVSDGDLRFVGQVIFDNTSGATKDASFELSADVLGRLLGTTKMGYSQLTLNISADGGTVTTLPNQSIVAFHVDDAVEGQLFHQGFMMGGSGQGTASTTSIFGAPIGSLAGSDVDDSIGFKVAAQLTAGEKLTTSVNFVMAGTGEVPPDVSLPQSGDDPDAIDPILELSVLKYHPTKPGVDKPFRNKGLIHITRSDAGEAAVPVIVQISIGNSVCQVQSLDISSAGADLIFKRHGGKVRAYTGPGEVQLLSADGQSELAADAFSLLGENSTAIKKLKAKLKAKKQKIGKNFNCPMIKIVAH